MKVVDARGLSCPQPVIETKKAVKDKISELEVIVDNIAAVENVTRFATATGYSVERKDEGGDTHLILKR